MNFTGKIPTGVLLLNLGGPDSINAVRLFLLNLFSDREIIRLGPSFMQKPLAYLISMSRAGKIEDAYKLIGGKSPILGITAAQAKALEDELNSEIRKNSQFSVLSSRLFKVYIAMRYWRPLIEEVIPKIHKDGVKRLVVLSLYPQYSVATTGSTLTKLNEVISRHPVEIYSVKSWYSHPLYIGALVDKIKKGIKLFPCSNNDVHVLFSAHSLPVKFIEEGDPYLDQIKGTIEEIEKKIEIKWDLSFQSKSGPVKWLEPSTEKMIEHLVDKGIRNILMVPISFVSDHFETLYEIDILYKKQAENLGIMLQRTESLNTSPLFISALEDIVLKGIKDAEWQT